MNEAELFAAVKAAKSKQIKPVRVGGRSYYVQILSPQQQHSLDCAIARLDWRDYYRSVRILRKLRRENYAHFTSFSQAWWECCYRDEATMRDTSKDWRAGIFATRSLADRLCHFKMRRPL